MANAVVVASEDVRMRLIAQGCPSEKSHVIPCGAAVIAVEQARDVGSQPCRFLATARKWVHRNRLADRTDLPDAVHWTTVRAALFESGAFVQHSITTRNGRGEGWGVALVEAAAAGLPVAATRSGGIRDQVVDGRTGYLVEENDVKGRADAICGLALDMGLRRPMGGAAPDRIREVGDATRQVEKLGGLLRSVVRSRGGEIP